MALQSTVTPPPLPSPTLLSMLAGSEIVVAINNTIFFCHVTQANNNIVYIWQRCKLTFYTKPLSPTLL